MPRYRKKPVVIEAEIYHIGLEDGFEVDGRFYFKTEPVPRVMHRRPALYTLEGWHIITPGDYIITGVKGERYPCKPDIFELTYELADGEGEV